jgi:hypothetical protein
MYIYIRIQYLRSLPGVSWSLSSESWALRSCMALEDNGEDEQESLSALAASHRFT